MCIWTDCNYKYKKVASVDDENRRDESEKKSSKTKSFAKTAAQIQILVKTLPQRSELEIMKA